MATRLRCLTGFTMEIGRLFCGDLGRPVAASGKRSELPSPSAHPRPPIVPTEAERAAHAAFLARVEDPDKAALAEDERARAEAIKSRTEPLRLAAQAADAAWQASRPPPKVETKIDRGQANGELARPQDSGSPRNRALPPSDLAMTLIAPTCGCAPTNRRSGCATRSTSAARQAAWRLA